MEKSQAIANPGPVKDLLQVLKAKYLGLIKNGIIFEDNSEQGLGQ